jgi:hypothetical protein
MDDGKRGIDNDARQSSETDPAFGQDESDFGAGGQQVLNREPRQPQRDIDRDSRLDKAGLSVSSGDRSAGGDR